MKSPAKVIKIYCLTKKKLRIMKTLHEIEIKSTTNSNYQVKITLSRDDENETHVIEIHSTENGKPWSWQDDEYNYSEALNQFINLVQEYAQHTILMNF